MFRKNDSHRQTDMFSIATQLPKKQQRMLERSWAETFYREFFCRIDEGIFSCLYSRDWSRPNTPVNQLVAFEVIKAGRGWSDEEAYEALCFDMQIRHALGVRDFGQEVFALRTVYNFRRALVQHMEATGENLFERVFEQVTGEQQKAWEIKSSRLRMDSTQIASNIRNLSRLELLVLVLQRVHRELDETDRHKWQAEFEPYVGDSARRYSYRLRGEEPSAHLTRIGALMERLSCALRAKYSDTPGFRLLCRVLEEQFSVINHVAMARHGKERSARSVQSPHDLQATYRVKNNKAYRGYVANLTETCDEGNNVQLIVDVAVEPNSTDDGQMLADGIDGLVERTDVKTIYADGGYNGPQVDVKLAEHKVELEQTGIRGSAAAGLGREAFDWELNDKHNPVAVACPGGQQVEVSRGRRSHTFSAGFDGTQCDKCTHREECPARPQKRRSGRVMRITRNQVLAAQRRRRSQALQASGRNPRASVEATVWSVTAPFPRGRIPYRGQARVSVYVIAGAAMANVRRITAAVRRRRDRDGVPPEARHSRAAHGLHDAVRRSMAWFAARAVPVAPQRGVAAA